MFTDAKVMRKYMICKKLRRRYTVTCTLPLPFCGVFGKWFLQRFWLRFLLYNFRKAGKTLGFDKTKKAYCKFL